MNIDISQVINVVFYILYISHAVADTDLCYLFVRAVKPLHCFPDEEQPVVLEDAAILP